MNAGGPSFRLAWWIARECGLFRAKEITALTAFFALISINAALDGVGLIMIVGLVSNPGGVTDPIGAWALSQTDATPQVRLMLVAALLALRAITTYVASFLDGVLNTIIRKRIQEYGLRRLIGGDWTVLREMRVGQRVGALTEEALGVTKYLMSVLRLTNALVTAVILMGLAVTVSAEITVLLSVVAIPSVLLLQLVFRRQNRLSAAWIRERQGFVADATERLQGMFQIKVEGDHDRHLYKALEHQRLLKIYEFSLAHCQAAIASLNVLLPALALLGFYAWSLLREASLSESLEMLATVGIIGARAAAQLNTAQGSGGNLARLAGSLKPVSELLMVPAERDKQRLLERLNAVRLDNVSYHYSDSARIDHVSLIARQGRPLVIRGPSGVGKSTLANLMAGVYDPLSGTVHYETAAGVTFDSVNYRPRVGYVTQDVYLFHGTLRENLRVGTNVSDDDLWACLRSVDADGFVTEMGGLDAAIAESGRSLSGGQRRRLGIARMLVRQPNLLILDETTAGLDDTNRRALLKTVDALAREFVVVIITHDPLQLSEYEEFRMGATTEDSANVH